MQINQIQIANAQSNNRTRVEIFEFQIEEVNRINIGLFENLFERRDNSSFLKTIFLS